MYCELESVVERVTEMEKQEEFVMVYVVKRIAQL